MDMENDYTFKGIQSKRGSLAQIHQLLAKSIVVAINAKWGVC